MRRLGKFWRIAGFCAVLAVVLGLGLVVAKSLKSNRALAAGKESKPAESPQSQSPRKARVRVVKPHTGGVQRTSNQPGSVEAFEYADLYAKISGYLKQQPVDIGTVVTEGQLLAEIDAPEFEQELKRAQAVLAQARTMVSLKEAEIQTAQAQVKIAQAGIKESRADLAKAKANREFRDIQYERIKELFRLKSIEERLVDEKNEELQAAQAAERSADAAISTAQAQADAAEAKVAQANAELEDARANVDVAQASVAKAKVFVAYTKIVSPYNGVVTKRDFHKGDFISAAGEGRALPLLKIARTDLMRVVVLVPERDVPYTNPGDPAIMEIDAIPDKKFHGSVSRVSDSEDRTSRAMRTEIDLDNSSHELRDGMFLRVTILLEKRGKVLTVPSSALVGDPQTKKFAVFVVRDGKAHRTRVEAGHDNGRRVEIDSGISADDLIVAHPTGDLADGAAVEVSHETETEGAKGRET